MKGTLEFQGAFFFVLVIAIAIAIARMTPSHLTSDLTARTMIPDPKIAVAGCGALGGFYGSKLSRAGRLVHFLLRSDHDVVRRKGFSILSPEGDFVVRPKCASRPEQIGPCDLLLIGLKTTVPDLYAELLTPMVGPHTVVLTLQNGLGNEARLARIFPPSQIMGGLCFVCLNRIEPGVVRHMDHGRVILGEYQGWPEPRTHDIASLFRHAGVPCQVTDNLDRTHWEKLVWNIPFNGLGVASCAGYGRVVSGEESEASGESLALGECLTTDRLLGEPRWEALVRALMREVLAAGSALGLGLDTRLEEKMVKNTRSMGAYKASTLIDFERGQPLELESLFLEPMRRAQAAGVAVPRLEALCRVLGQLDPGAAEPG